MFIQNLKQAIRHLRKDKTNTFINILGLTLGLSIVTIVTVFLINELGYNSSVKKHDKIYRVLNYNDNDKRFWTTTPYILADYAKEHISGIESITGCSGNFSLSIKQDDEYISEKGIMSVDTKFIKMFNIKILQGKVEEDFDETNNKILISKSSAHKYFGKQDVVGKDLIMNIDKKDRNMQIVAVFDDIPNNSSLKANMLVGMKTYSDNYKSHVVSVGDVDVESLFYSWEGTISISNYIMIKDGVDYRNVENQIASIGKENSTEHNKLNFSLQSLDEVYFGSSEFADNTNLDKGNLSMVHVLALIGLIILLIACINYLNLSSAQAFMRMRNLSVNRVFGATRMILIKQVITESVLVAFIALPPALLLAYYLMPKLNEFLGHDYPIVISNSLTLAISSLIVITSAVGALAGWLVTLKVTSFNIVDAIKGKNMFVGNKFFMRKTTITFQFMVFVVLLVVVFGVHKQIDYLMNVDMGFVKGGLIKINKGDKDYNVYKNEILKNPNVLSVSAALWLPPSNNRMTFTGKVEGEKVNFRANLVDYDFVSTMGMKLLKGEVFNREKHKSGVLLTQSAYNLYDDKDDIIGKNMGFGTVVGVVSDFQMSSLHTKSDPIILLLQPASCGDIAVRVKSSNIKSTISSLENEFNKLEGEQTFNYQFTDDVLSQMYESDTHFSQIIALLAFISVFIASLGLFGLSVLINKQRTKEIGVRKINGATMSEILLLLNKDFLKWVVLSIVLSIPISYFAVNKWLENFAYKTSVSWWIFALAGLSAVFIAIITVSWQSYRTASRNPIDALRYE